MQSPWEGLHLPSPDEVDSDRWRWRTAGAVAVLARARAMVADPIHWTGRHPALDGDGMPTHATSPRAVAWGVPEVLMAACGPQGATYVHYQEAWRRHRIAATLVLDLGEAAARSSHAQDLRILDIAIGPVRP